MVGVVSFERERESMMLACMHDAGLYACACVFVFSCFEL